MNLMQMPLCPWEPATYLFFSSNVPALVHYSHMVAILAAAIVAVYVFFNSPRSIVPQLFLMLVTTFSAWTILDLVLWATNRPDVVMFAWSLQILLEPLTYGIAFFLYYQFLYNRWPSFRIILAIACLYVPLAVLLPTTFNLSELYLSDCEAIEGPLAKYYTHFVHSIFIIAIAWLAAHATTQIKQKNERAVALLLGIGLVCFLLAFSSGTIIGSMTDDWVLSQYGLFGMPIFAAFVAYCIIRFNAFNAKVLTAELLVVFLGVGVVSLTALQNIQTVRIVSAATFALVCIVGYILIRNVRQEIHQRELIEAQEKQLEVANQQQESLLHFISHEVKGYLTKGQNAFAGIVEKDYGEPTEQINAVAKTALIEMRKGVATVMDILDASNLKKGTVSYKKTSFDVVASVHATCDEMMLVAEEKGLTLERDTDTEPIIIEGDEAKIRHHVIRNLIDNAIRYT